MTVIDLLNKIANGEEVPRHIKLNDTEWYWNDYDGYVDKWSLSTTPDAQHYLYNHYRLDFCLDKEIEIVEEPKKIEKVKLLPDRDNNGHSYRVEVAHDNIKTLANKIDEIIDYINKGDSNDN